MVKSNPVCLIDEELHAILDLFYCGQAGESAALAAAANGHSDTLCLLLDRGADVNDVDSVRDVTAFSYPPNTALGVDDF